jgi:hypothetical protein
MDVVGAHVERHLAHALGRVGVEEHAPLRRAAADLADRLNRPDLVVGGHHGDEDGPVGDRGRDVLRPHEAPGVHRQVRHLDALRGREIGQRVEDGRMLDRRRDDVALLAVPLVDDPQERQAVRLGRAGREDDLARVGADQPGYLPPRPLDRLVRLPSEAVAATRCVPELSPQVGQHRLEHARIHRRRGVVVEVDHLAAWNRILPRRIEGVLATRSRAPAIPPKAAQALS